MTHDFDVIVAGGGPAGSSTANFLAQRGRRVLVAERERFPRFHIGESLLPFANDLWRELGVYDTLDRDYQHKPGAHFCHEETGLELTYYFDRAIRPGNPYAFQVKRAAFDAMLLDRAREVGVDVRQGVRVGDVDVRADGVVARLATETGDGYEVKARAFVDATGRDAMLASRYGWKVADGLITSNVAVHSMYSGVERLPGGDAGNITVGLFDGGWYWVIPFKDGDTSIGMVIEKTFAVAHRGLDAAALMDAALARLPRLGARLAGARRVLAVGAQANWSYRCRRWGADRMLLVGDAAAFVDPLFSTGVLFAVYGARYAADALDAALDAGALDADALGAYQARCEAGMNVFTTLVHEFYARNLRRVLIASARHPTICKVITSMLAGDVYRPSLWHAMVRSGFSEGIL
jgi:flavin-dependent dehydrogenase